MKKVLLGSLSIILVLVLLLPFYSYAAEDEISVLYSTHIQNKGWETVYKKDGQTAGTMGQSLRLEGIKIKLENKTAYSGNIEYSTHVEKIGWQEYVKNDEMAGTNGLSLRLEAIKIRLTDELAEHYDIYYRAFAQNHGWLDWAKNDQIAGTAGYSFRLEAIDIKLVKKGEPAPGKTDLTYLVKIPTVEYTTHVQNVGWQEYVADGKMAGTSGLGLRLEGIKIRLKNKSYAGDIEYTTHVQNIGWQEYVKNDEMAGTNGLSLRLEAIRIRLTGEMAEKYDIYYRVHAQNAGWLNWAKNDSPSGTAGYGLRLEGIEIVIVNKGDQPPAVHVDNDKSYLEPTPDPLPPEDTKINGLITSNLSDSIPVYRYEDIRATTLMSNNEIQLTEDILKCRVVEAPAGVNKNNILEYESAGAGKFNVKLKASVAGTYKIIPAIEGDIVQNGKYEAAPLTVEVKENYAINAIRLYDGDRVVYDSKDTTPSHLKLKVGSIIMPTIKYFHVYNRYDNTIEYVEILDEKLYEKRLDIEINVPKSTDNETGPLSNMSAPYNNDNMPIEYDNDGNMTSGYSKPISKLVLESTDMTGTENITVHIPNNPTYHTDDFETVINVDVEEIGNLVGITLDGKNKLTTESNYALNLYNTVPADKTEGVDYRVEEDGLVYTIIPMLQLDENGNTTRTIRGNVGLGKSNDKEGKIGISEIGNTFLSNDLKIKFYYTNVYLTYASTLVTEQRISAIGLAISSTANMDKLSQGVSIKFDGANGREEAVLKLYIDGQAVTPQVSAINTDEVPEVEITKPNNLVYSDGEEIDFEGLVVTNKETGETLEVVASDTIASLEKADENGVQTIILKLKENGTIIGEFDIMVTPVVAEDEEVIENTIDNSVVNNNENIIEDSNNVIENNVVEDQNTVEDEETTENIVDENIIENEVITDNDVQEETNTTEEIEEVVPEVVEEQSEVNEVV